MNSDKLNELAFYYVSNLSQKEILKRKKAELRGSIKERGINDFSDKEFSFGIEKATNRHGETTAIYLTTNRGIIGFNDSEYPKFKSLIQEIHQLDFFNRSTTFDYLESKSMYWFIDLYKSQQARSDLISHLEDSVSQDIFSYEFMFPVINLEIEKPFQIGVCEFNFFTKEYIDGIFSYLTTKKKENYRKRFDEEYKGKVYVRVVTKGTHDKALEQAQSKAETAIDILKIYDLTIFEPDNGSSFNINYRLDHQLTSTFLSKKEGEKVFPGETVNFKNAQFSWTEDHHKFAISCGLNTLTEYVFSPTENEFKPYVIQAIHLFSSSLAISDNHIRIVNLITIIESVLLKENEDNGLQKKCINRFYKFVGSDHEEKMKIKNLLTEIYNIRHKMIHKANRLKIVRHELAQFQTLILDFIFKLIQATSNFDSKDDLITELNNRNS